MRLDILEQALMEGRKEIPHGNVASYIPQLSTVNKNRLGLCIHTKDGKSYSVGDTQERFTMQSISKVISLALALQLCGFGQVFSKVGMEPSGDAFDSLVKLDLSGNYPNNPMINSGAITVASCLIPVVSFEEILGFVRKICLDPDLALDNKVYQSEMSHVARNRAIAYLLESKGITVSDVEKSLDLYVKMCSLSVTAEGLAGIGLVLALGGICPETGKRFFDSQVVRVVKTIMLTCGMYNGSGEFAVHVGMPSKSGVGGGILSVVDHRFGIGIYGPSLDDKGNSIAGRCALRYLSEKLHLHIFSDQFQEEIASPDTVSILKMHSL